MYSFVPNCKSSNKIVGGLFLGHSFIKIKWTGGVFFPKFANWPLSTTITHKKVMENFILCAVKAPRNQQKNICDKILL